jgi:hypothetical protein
VERRPPPPDDPAGLPPDDDEAPDLGAPTRVEDVLAAEKWAREHARGLIAGG